MDPTRKVRRTTRPLQEPTKRAPPYPRTQTVIAAPPLPTQSDDVSDALHSLDAYLSRPLLPRQSSEPAVVMGAVARRMSDRGGGSASSGVERDHQHRRRPLRRSRSDHGPPMSQVPPPQPLLNQDQGMNPIPESDRPPRPRRYRSKGALSAPTTVSPMTAVPTTATPEPDICDPDCIPVLPRPTKPRRRRHRRPDSPSLPQTNTSIARTSPPSLLWATDHLEAVVDDATPPEGPGSVHKYHRRRGSNGGTSSGSNVHPKLPVPQKRAPERSERRVVVVATGCGWVAVEHVEGAGAAAAGRKKQDDYLAPLPPRKTNRAEEENNKSRRAALSSSPPPISSASLSPLLVVPGMSCFARPTVQQRRVAADQ
ncbi:hypothetical protein BC828DRAFT_261801 [Blastocladiella britannica]|nr:hypothetical protein BC828DRAFT_261801 [Blastocladiella britannica]